MKRTYATLRKMYDNAEIDGDTFDDMVNELDLMNRDGIEIEDDDQPTIDEMIPEQVIEYIEEEARKESYLRAFFAGMTNEAYNDWLDEQSEEAGLRYDATH